MGEYVRLFMASAALAAALAALVYSCRIVDVGYTRAFGTAEENARTTAFEGTKVYRDGVKHDMDDMCLAYARAQSPDERAAVASLLEHRAQAVPPELVPPCARRIREGAQ